MSEGQKKIPERQPWYIADTLRRKMNADEYINHILDFIFCNCLSEKLEAYADKLPESESRIYTTLDPGYGEE